MIAISVRNPFANPFTLPAPFVGVLAQGQTIILPFTQAEFLAFGSWTSLLVVNQLPATYPGPIDTSFLGSYVPNIAALTKIPGADGVRVYVLTVQSPWQYVENGTGFAIDHITVEATADGGNSRWVRDPQYASPIWNTYGFIYIDGTNGNDENQGFYTTQQTSPAALKTHAEMFRRLGEIWTPTQNVTVKYNTTYPADPLHLVIHFEGSYTVNFDAPAFVQNSTGTFSAVTVRNNATNTPYEVVDGTVDTSGDVTRRIRITGGVRSGTQAWVAKSTGAGRRRTSEWVVWDPVSIFLNAITPQVGDPYVVESTASQLLVSHIVVEHSNGYGANYVGPSLVFNDIDFVPPTAHGTTYFENNGCYLSFQDCLFTDGEWQIRTIARAGDFSSAFTTIANCCFGNVGINNTLISQGGVTENYILGGLGFGQIAPEGSGGATVGFNYLAQGELSPSTFPNPAAIHGGQLVIDSMGVMDWHGIIGGVMIEDALVSLSGGTLGDTTAYLWGSSTVGGTVGVSINAGASLRYDPGAQITITGAAGDFLIAGSNVARAWNDTAGAYTANLPCTWANLVGGALLDNAHNLMQNAHAYKNTGGAQP